MDEQTADRLTRLRERLAADGLDQLLVTDLQNIRYLSGFTGTAATLLIGSESAAFLTDFRYVTQAAEQVSASFDRLDGGDDPRKTLTDLFSGKVGFDDAHTTVASFRRFDQAKPAESELVAAGGVVEDLRAVKDQAELKAISQAAEIADQIYRRLVEDGFAGKTEQFVARRIEQLAHEFGAEGLSFPPIVAHGGHGALPHAEPRDVAIGRAQLIVVDLGVKFEGYCSDATRTFAVGNVSDAARDVYGIVLEAQLAGLEAVTEGAQASAVDNATREIITAAGHGERFGHSTGHGVGLEVHERPTLSHKSSDVLLKGNVVTVEPGIYLDGQFGVRIEDLVVVEPAGSPRILSGFPKELITTD